MQLVDFSFLLYFLPAMLAGYFALFFSKKAQGLWLLLCYLAFYSLGSLAHLIFMLALIGANYHLGYGAHRARAEGKTSPALTLLAVIINLLPLFFYRYLYPFLDTVSGLLGLTSPAAPLAPLGVSFLALMGLSYYFDIYRGKARWKPGFTDTALYFAFFAPLFAGPIIRYHTVAGQTRPLRLAVIADGFCRMVIGLAKVVLLARPLLLVADIVFQQSNLSGIYTVVPVSLALLGLIAYGLGLYHYLSGMSDLVIGLGRILGLVYHENFNYPIMAASVSSLVRRAYCSLYAWFDEYVYKPLQGKRVNNDSMVLHLLLVWLLIGLWLGPSVTNIIFSLWIFFFILLEKIIEFDNHEHKGPFSHIYVITVTLMALIALKTDNVYQMTLFISNLFGMKDNGFTSDLAVALIKETWPVLAAALFFSFPPAAKLRRHSEEKGGFISLVYILYPLAILALAALVVLAVSGRAYDPGQLINFFLWGDR